MKKHLIYFIFTCFFITATPLSTTIEIPLWIREVSAESLRTALWTAATYYTSTWATHEIELCRNAFTTKQYGLCLLSAACTVSALNLMSKSGYYAIQHAQNALNKLEGSEKEKYCNDNEEAFDATKIITALRIIA